MGGETAAEPWFDGDFAAYHAGVRPGKLAALVFKTGERLTYRDLHLKVDQATKVLQEAVGDLRGQRIAVLARNSAEFLVLINAAYRAGAILLPLNWRLSPPELAYLLADADPALVVYDDEFAAPLMAALSERLRRAPCR